jgi:hypothetical protein
MRGFIKDADLSSRLADNPTGISKGDINMKKPTFPIKITVIRYLITIIINWRVDKIFGL